MIGERFEVLHDGCEGEFVTGSTVAAKAKSFQAVVTFEMSDQNETGRLCVSGVTSRSIRMSQIEGLPLRY